MLWTSAQVARMRPRVVAARTAYDMSSVDAYLVEIVSALREWEDGTRAAGCSLTSQDVWEASFPTVPTAFSPGTEGYDHQSTTSLLRSFSRTLRAYEARFPIGSVPPDTADSAPLRPGVRVTSQEVASRTFVPVRFIAGYARDEVDAFMARAVTSLRAHEKGVWAKVPRDLLTSADTRSALFQATAWVSGYHQKDVDDFLDDIAWTLAGYEKQPRPAPTQHANANLHALTSSEVARHNFATVRLHEGYRPDEVDAFMTRIVATLQACEASEAKGVLPDTIQAPVSPGDIEAVTFRTTVLRRGYNEEEVDSLLDHVASTLRGYSAGQEPVPR